MSLPDAYQKKNKLVFTNIFVFFSVILKYLKSNNYNSSPIIDAIQCLNNIHMSSFDDYQNFYDYIFISSEIKECLDFFVKSGEEYDFNGDEYIVPNYHDSIFFNKMVKSLRDSSVGSFVLLGKDPIYIYLLYKSSETEISIIWIALKGNVRYGSNAV